MRCHYVDLLTVVIEQKCVEEGCVRVLTLCGSRGAMDAASELRGKLEAVKRMYNAQADANVALEDELHATRVALAAVEAQRDVLLERLISIEGDAWEVSSDGADERPALQPAAKRRAIKRGEKVRVCARRWC